MGDIERTKDFSSYTRSFYCRHFLVNSLRLSRNNKKKCSIMLSLMLTILFNSPTNLYSWLCTKHNHKKYTRIGTIIFWFMACISRSDEAYPFYRKLKRCQHHSSKKTSQKHCSLLSLLLNLHMVLLTYTSQLTTITTQTL